MTIAPDPLHPHDDWSNDPWDDAEMVPTVEHVRRHTRTIKWIVWSAFAVVIALVLVAGATGWWYLNRINPGVTDSAPVNFTVADDDTIETLSERLEAEGIVTDAGVFRWYAQRDGNFEPTPGFFQIVPGDHMGNVLGRLSTPPERTFTRVTFPEGFTADQMAARLDATVVRMSADEFRAAATPMAVRPQYLPPGINTLEGLLFPDTYQVSNSESEAQVVERMVALMERVARQENLEARAVELGMDPYDVFIIASMIEREAKLDEDRAQIAAVIRNRLFVEMPLQIDATLYYGHDTDTPFSELLEIDSPYNTYMYGGLPPTPIANPGRASIRAALNPAPPPPPGDPVCQELPDPTTCFYFYYVLSDTNGGHTFAATLEQHERNVLRSRELGLLG
ncbi:hypothetical protein BH23ACT3_BH23ACT3_22100 [soil metagenome]